MSNAQDIRNYLSNNYDAPYLQNYLRDNNLYRAGMNTNDVLDTASDALRRINYRVNGVAGSGGALSPRTYNRNTATGARNRSYGRTNYANRTSTGGSTGRSRSNSRTQGAEPQSSTDCPTGTYFRSATQRSPTTVEFNGQQIQRAGSYVKATCAKLPEGNPWWNAIDKYTDTHPGVSGAEAASILSQTGLYQAQGASRGAATGARSRSYGRTNVGSNNAMGTYGGSNFNRASVGSANMGSYGAGLSGTGNTALGSYNTNRSAGAYNRSANY